MRERPNEFLDRRTIEEEGLDAAARDFLAGMTDRYAVSLYEQLFIPKSWVSLDGLVDVGDSSPSWPLATGYWLLAPERLDAWEPGCGRF